MTNEVLLRARIVWPVSRPPIENGALLIEDGLIQDVGSYEDLKSRHNAPTEDIGEVLLMPGLINAHCHLDYTHMAGLIPPPAKNAFPDWIKNILSLKAHWSYTEFAQSWVAGARQLLDSGVTTVGDFEAVPELLPDAWQSTPLRVISFLEMTGVRSAKNPERILAETLAHVARLPQTDRHQATIAPHALYSTPPALLQLTARENKLTAIHLAESQPEWDMFQNASGPLYDWLKTQRNMDDCGNRSPIQQAHHLGLLNTKPLIIHANYLANSDPSLLAANQCSVIHCPRSHEYFQHAPFPYEQLAAAGVNISIATDSLASILPLHGKPPTLNLWQDLQHFAKKNPNIRPETILKMATQNPARALRLPAGVLAPNHHADLITLSYTGNATSFAASVIEAPQIIHRWIAGAPH